MSKIKEPAPPAFDPLTVISRKEAAAMLEIDPSRISQLVSLGYIQAVKPGRMTIAAAARGYAKYWQEKASETTKTSAESRVRDARAQEIEMRNAERMRTLIPLDEALAIMDEYAAVVREAMDSIPARVTRDLPVRRKIEAEVNAAHEAIAKVHGSSRTDARKGKDRSH